MLITSAWQKTLEDILHVGALLIEAKDELNPGEYEAMIEDDLPFDKSTARRLKIIAEHSILSDRAYTHVLPASWMTIYELSKHQPARLLALIEDGTVNPRMQQKDAIALLPNRNSSGAHAPNEPRRCPICADTARVPVGHHWSEDDDVEDQANTVDLVDKLTEEIQRIFGRLRPNIERVIDERVHPDIRTLLADALREHAAVATRLADRLSLDQ